MKSQQKIHSLLFVCLFDANAFDSGFKCEYSQSEFKCLVFLFIDCHRLG